MIILKEAAELSACRLGDGSNLERLLLFSGKLRRNPDGTWLVFSRETDTQGQVAQIGDYVKLDSENCAYPNEKAWFEARHIPLGGTRYRQITRPTLAWCHREPMSEEIRFLLDTGRLWLDETDETHYFRAFLWGAELFAAKDAVIVFDEITRDESGAITEIQFHFLAWAEFVATCIVVG